jgi:signal transduction histidine kinase
MRGAWGKPRAYWGGYILAALVVLMAALRIPGNFSGTPALGPAFLALGCYSLLFLLEFLFSGRVRWPWSLYFGLQAGCLLFLASLQPFLDVITSAYLPLAVQAFYYRPRREASFWALVFAVLLSATLARGLGLAEGLPQGMMIIAEGIILTTFALLVVQSQKDREESQALVTELQEAHRKLQEYAAQAGQLAATRERNRLARELHDSAGQMIFSIQLVAESARLLVEREPARAPELLDQLEEMTGTALRQLRSLITELRIHT